MFRLRHIAACGAAVALAVSVLAPVSAVSAADGVSDLYCARASAPVVLGDPQGSGDPGCWVRAGEANAAGLAPTVLSDAAVSFYFLRLSGLAARWDTRALPAEAQGVSWRVSEADTVLIVDAATVRAGLVQVLLATNDEGSVEVTVDVSRASSLSLVNTSRVFDATVKVHAVAPRIEITSVSRDGRTVRVAGVVHGVPPGTEVTPFVRTAPQSTFTAGKVRARTGPGGEFTWTRALNKKAYAYFTTIADLVSEQVSLPGRNPGSGSPRNNSRARNNHA